MRHQYDHDGNIPYVGKVRASRPWRTSRHRTTGNGRTQTRTDTIAAQEYALAQRDHKERIQAILNSSKWSSHDYNQQ